MQAAAPLLIGILANYVWSKLGSNTRKRRAARVRCEITTQLPDGSSRTARYEGPADTFERTVPQDGRSPADRGQPEHMIKPDPQIRRICLEDPRFGEARDTLLAFKSRVDASLSPTFWEGLKRPENLCGREWRSGRGKSMLVS